MFCNLFSSILQPYRSCAIMRVDLLFTFTSIKVLAAGSGCSGGYANAVRRCLVGSLLLEITFSIKSALSVISSSLCLIWLIWEPDWSGSDESLIWSWLCLSTKSSWNVVRVESTVIKFICCWRMIFTISSYLVTLDSARPSNFWYFVFLRQ